MNILLADDERLTRLGLKSMIEELCPGAHQFSEAADGKTLLEKLKEETPDLIFLDIHMPKLTGLQAFSRFSGRKIPVVMLTGYAEFAYAQEALKLGALDYLLKPASLDEVRATLEKACTLCEERELLLRKDYELEFEKILDLYTTIGFLQTPRHVLAPYTAILFYFDHYRKETFNKDLETLSALTARLSSLYHARFTLSFLAGGEICYLASATIPAEELKPELLKFHHTSVCTATGFSISAGDLPGLFEQIEAVQREESLRYCIGLGSVISPWERRAFKELLPLSELLEKLLAAYHTGDTIRFQNLLTSLEELPEADRLLGRCDNSLNQILSIESQTTVNIHSADQLREFFTRLKSQNQNIHLIDKINAYMEKNYMNQIGINTIADMIDISPNYLSRIYKLKTGENFIDHLTRIRVKKAAELMSGGQTTTVRDTAERVGYFSTRYFTKVFLKNTGISPSEYLKTHLPPL